MHFSRLALIQYNLITFQSYSKIIPKTASLPPQLPDNQRLPYIDTAKGICILLVVLLHTALHSIIIDFLGLLLMPLFFTLSGMFYKDSDGIKITLLKQINKIIIPFCFFYIIGYATYVTIQILAHNEIEKPFTYIIYAKHGIPNGALWFLLALFWAKIFFMILRRVSKNDIFLGATSLFMAVGSLILFSGETKLPLFIDSAFIALPFLFFGYYIKKTGLFISEKYDKYAWPAIMLLITISIICYITGDSPFIAIYSVAITGNPVLFGVGAIALVCATILLCKKVGAIPFITYIGRFSLIVLGLHLLVQQIIRTGLKFVGMDSSNDLHNIIFYFIIVGICALIIKPLSRYLPWFTGQRNLIPFDSHKHK